MRSAERKSCTRNGFRVKMMMISPCRVFDKVFPTRIALMILFDLCVWVGGVWVCTILFRCRTSRTKVNVEHHHHRRNPIEWFDEFIIEFSCIQFCSRELFGWVTSYFNEINFAAHSTQIFWQIETFSCDAISSGFSISFIRFVCSGTRCSSRQLHQQLLIRQAN